MMIIGIAVHHKKLLPSPRDSPVCKAGRAAWRIASIGPVISFWISAM
jgi:hypothetical protein